MRWPWLLLGLCCACAAVKPYEREDLARPCMALEVDAVTAQYRYYTQDAASFYALRYTDIVEPRSGDPRLGQVIEHSPGLSAEYAITGQPGMAGALTLGGSYELAWLDHRSAGVTTVSHVLGLRLAGNY